MQKAVLSFKADTQKKRNIVCVCVYKPGPFLQSYQNFNAHCFLKVFLYGIIFAFFF